MSDGEERVDDGGDAQPYPGFRNGILLFRQRPAGVDGVSLFDKRLHPAEHALPSVAVVMRGLGIAGEAAMPHLQQRAAVLRGEFPTHGGFEIAGPAGDPGVNQQARRVEFQVLAPHLKCAAIGALCSERTGSNGLT